MLSVALALLVPPTDIQVTPVPYRPINTGAEFSRCVQDEVLLGLLDELTDGAAAERSLIRCNDRSFHTPIEVVRQIMLTSTTEFARNARSVLPPAYWDTASIAQPDHHYSLAATASESAGTACADLANSGRGSNFTQAVGLVRSMQLTPKSEFESSASFRLRSDAATGALRSKLGVTGSALVYHTFEVAARGRETPGKLTYSYNSETQIMRISYAGKEQNYTAWHDSEVVTVGLSSIPTRLIGASEATRPTRYFGSNAFGTRASISRTRYVTSRWGFGRVRFGNSDWVEDFDLGFEFSVPPELAERTIPRLRVLMAGELTVAGPFEFNSDIMLPSVTHPIDSKTTDMLMVAPPVCAVLIDSLTRRVLSEQRIQIIVRPRR